MVTVLESLLEDVSIRSINYKMVGNLRKNPNMQLTTIIQMKYLNFLDLSAISPENISPDIIPQFPNLSRLIMENISFNSTCNTQWICKLSDFELHYTSLVVLA